MIDIDLRSDTVTKPNFEMRQAMYDSLVGDDVLEDDITTKKLEAQAAKITGKEAGLFVPSGTMGNQLAILCHTNRGVEIICGANSHIVSHESGAPGLLSGVNICAISNDNDFIYPNDIQNAIRDFDIHEPITTLLCLENALSNGTVMPLDIMRDNYKVAKDRGLNVHLDGARLFNASVYLNVDPKKITKYCDSVTFCLSKGLGAPIGSILCGSKSFINKARRYRKALGGGMRQTGVLTAPGTVALNNYFSTITTDHANATTLSKNLSTIPYIKVNVDDVHINMVFIEVCKNNFNFEDFLNFLLSKKIKILPVGHNKFRLVTHHNITSDNIDYVIEIFKKYFK